MADIRYKWMSSEAVAMTENLTLPQFKIIGHLQKAKQVALSTGQFLKSHNDSLVSHLK